MQQLIQIIKYCENQSAVFVTQECLSVWSIEKGSLRTCGRSRAPLFFHRSDPASRHCHAYFLRTHLRILARTHIHALRSIDPLVPLMTQRDSCKACKATTLGRISASQECVATTACPPVVRWIKGHLY